MLRKILSEKTLLIAACGALAAMSLWLQFVVLRDDAVTEEIDRSDEPDYYIENFTAVGMDDLGERRYVLEAERMVHFPADGTALLDNPHVIQYEAGTAPKHTYAESGWVGPAGDEVLMTGNVRVIQGRGSSSGGGVMKTEKLRVRLKKKLDMSKIN